jgi:hypothetical protein
VSISLTGIEDIIDRSGIAPRIEALLPTGVRHRQLEAATLLTGMMLTLDDDRPAHLTRVHQALTTLPEADQVRLGVIEDWARGPHQLTYRQAGRTFNLIVKTLAKEHPDGAPSGILAAVCDDLLEASIPVEYKQASRSLAVDWTDVESFPGHHGTARRTALTPRPTGGTAPATCPAPGAKCSSATTCRPPPWWQRRTALRSRSWPGG